MKTILLTKGYSTIVDDDDYALLSRHKWHAWKDPNHRHVYAARAEVIKGSRPQRLRYFKMHRVLLGVTDPAIHVDHVDGDGLNNTRANIRVATPVQNAANSRKRCTARTSRFKGVSVSWRAKAKHLKRPWLAQVNDGHGTQRPIGHFATELGAAAAYNAAAYHVYGAFARLNVLPD